MILVLSFRGHLKNVSFKFGGGTLSIFSSEAMKIKSFFAYFFLISKFQQENKELTEKLASLEVDRSKIEEQENENTLLKKELGFIQGNTEYSLVPAKIIGREPASFLDYVIIDKGRNQNIAENMAVISSGALVGQVAEAYDDQSKVTLITSKDAIILTMLQESRAKGVLRGGISGLVMEDIIQDVEIKPGEYVITSGLEGELRQGILIGKTSKLKSSSSDLFKSVVVEPIVDLSRLELVFVMK